MLRICAEHLTEDAEHQSVAVLGIALVVLGEDVGTEVSAVLLSVCIVMFLLLYYSARALVFLIRLLETFQLNRIATYNQPMRSCPHVLSLISTHTLPLFQMSLRTFDHLLHYGELPVKRVVPLALALLYVSNLDYSVIDQLSRLSHDQVTSHFL